MNITPENVLSAEHNSWLTHPVTIQMFKNLNKHRDTFVKSMVVVAGDMAIDDKYFRIHAYGLRTLDAVVEQLRNPNKFVEQSTK